ncbi:hypothetical protein FRC08_016380, partial [Ceratobasidium sp. 394]
MSSGTPVHLSKPSRPRPSFKRSLSSIMSSFSRRPRASPNPRRTSSWEVTESPPPQLQRSGQRLDIVESGGAALVDAQDAFIDSNRAVWTRIVWSLPSEHDARVLEVLERVGRREVREELAQLG